ncbi:MAG TPA: hypothetical protein VMZ31_06325 [Phycisphaerae bacterium]|nr:hypothetical protein [Phycisphaerae bacterium]
MSAKPQLSRLGIIWALSFAAGLTTAAWADPPTLSIYQIQYTTNADGSSNYDGQVVDCIGGIVVGKFPGSKPRLILQDPNFPDGWGGIQVKDWIQPDYDLFNHAEVGDWIEFTNMLVEESWGTTFLHRQTAYNPGYSVVSQGNAVPAAIVVSVSDIPAPVHDPNEDEWFVANHDAEPYESMRLTVRDVTVTEMDLGDFVDNYQLEDGEGGACWAADYMNQDVGDWGYHEFVDVGRHFCAVTGVFEQYTWIAEGYDSYDYYQLITLDTAGLAICGDGNADGVVDLGDLPRFVECMTGPMCEPGGGCWPPAWTQPPLLLPVERGLMMDMDYDGDVDLHDFGGFQLIFAGP